MGNVSVLFSTGIITFWLLEIDAAVRILMEKKKKEILQDKYFVLLQESVPGV